MAIDEIQTGFWTPDMFMYKQYGITPDILIVGKGMTAGFHPLSAIIYRRHLDILAQYDAISTNGNAALASLVALASLDLIEKNAARIQAVSGQYRSQLEDLCARYPKKTACVNGSGLMAGLKFKKREDASAFHKQCVDAGMWLRLHTYHPGHSTILTKFSLNVTPKIIDAFVEKLARLLDQMS
jgi:acetylornithine/succinyldiaminopimelate/putrescine aminotransferase